MPKIKVYENNEWVEIGPRSKEFYIEELDWGVIDTKTWTYSYILKHDLRSRNIHIASYANGQLIELDAEILDDTHIKFTNDKTEKVKIVLR